MLLNQKLMDTNEQIIYKFYRAFKNKDYKTMQECYADKARFSDPVFPDLKAEQVRAMWEMFCVKSKDLIIEFRNVETNETQGKAEWTAIYTFSSTGREVVNNIKTHFIFENGKIIKHTDRFNFYNWSKQALGITGALLGWTPFIKSKVQKSGMKSLNEFINRRTQVIK